MDMDQNATSFWAKLRAWWHGDEAKLVPLEYEAERRRARAEAAENWRREKPEASVQKDPVASSRQVSISERLWGTGYSSPVDDQLLQALLDPLALEAGKEVLDVGAGLGGGALLLAEKYGVKVTALEQNREFVDFCNSQDHPVSKHAGIEFSPFAPNTIELPIRRFQAVIIRETLLSLEGKDTLLKKIRDFLLPGGHLIVIEYALREADSKSDVIEKWVEQEGLDIKIKSTSELVSLVRLSGLNPESNKIVAKYCLKRFDNAWKEVLKMLAELASKKPVDKKAAVALLEEASLISNRTTALKSGDLTVLQLHAKAKGSSALSDW